MSLNAWIFVVCLITALLGGRRYWGVSLVVFAIFAELLIAHAQGHLYL